MAGHLDLVTMWERVEVAGGWFVFDTRQGADAIVRYWVPLSLSPAPEV